MKTLYLLDVPENEGVVAVARSLAGVVVDMVGPYFRFSSEDVITIDRRSTGVRHAVWYSCVAGLSGGRITQYDKDALRIDRP